MVHQILNDDIFQTLRTGDIILFNSESPGIYGYFDFQFHRKIVEIPGSFIKIDEFWITINK